MAECVLKPCKDKGGELITLTRKGVDKIIQCSEIREDGVKEKFKQNEQLQVHSKCRRTYIIRPRPPQHDEEAPKRFPVYHLNLKPYVFFVVASVWIYLNAETQLKKNGA